MGETVHPARIRIVQKQRPNREAHIEGFAEPLRFGMHGGNAEFYRLPQGECVSQELRRAQSRRLAGGVMASPSAAAGARPRTELRRRRR